MSIIHWISKKSLPISCIEDVQELLEFHGLPKFETKLNQGPHPKKLLKALNKAQLSIDTNKVKNKKYSVSIDENTLVHKSVTGINYRFIFFF